MIASLQSLMLHLTCFALALGLWSLGEYWVHLVLCHHRKNKIASKIHWDHHRMIGGITKEKLDAKAYGKNTTLYIAAGAIPILWLIFSIFFGASFGFVMAVGFATGYLHYEYVHWRIHCRAPRNKYEQRLLNHHFAHHYCDPKRYQSVTVPAIDHFFGTIPSAKIQAEHYERIKVRKPLDSVDNAWSWIWDKTTELRDFEKQPESKLAV